MRQCKEEVGGRGGAMKEDKRERVGERDGSESGVRREGKGRVQ